MSGPIPQAPDPGRRRAALMLGLESVLTPPQVEDAIALWDRDYARQRSMALAEYVGEISQRLGFDLQQRHALRVALYASVARNDVKPSTVVPMRKVTPAAPPPPPPLPAPVSKPKSAVSPAFTVFACMAAEMRVAAERAGTQTQAEFASALDHHALASRLHAEAGVLVRWGRGTVDLDELAALPEKRLATAMHAIYAALAEALGPVAADRTLGRAAQLADALPEAREFAPSRLL